MVIQTIKVEIIYLFRKKEAMPQIDGVIATITNWKLLFIIPFLHLATNGEFIEGIIVDTF